MRSFKGITIITLVITIVIILILAGIVITIAIGDNGIINKAQMAGKNYLAAQNYEENQLEQTVDYIANFKDKNVLKKAIIASENYSGNSGRTYTYDVSNYDNYKLFTIDNFAIDLTYVTVHGGFSSTTNRTDADIIKNYDAQNGIFTFTILTQRVNSTAPILNFNVCLYYIE